MEEQIDKDLKAALLAADKTKTEVLKSLKNALQYEALGGDKEAKLSDEQVQKVFARESKKRQEAADLYKQGGSSQRAEAELAEKQIIDSYLPEQVTEAEITKQVEEEITNFDSPKMSDMGKIISSVRSKLGASADGATIARLVRQKLEPK